MSLRRPVHYTLGHLDRSWPDVDGQQQLAHGIDRGPYPGTARLEVLEGLLLTDLAFSQATPYGWNVAAITADDRGALRGCVPEALAIKCLLNVVCLAG